MKNLHSIEEQYFRGNQFACSNGLLAWGFTLVFPFILFLLADAEVATVLFFIIFLILFLPFSTTLNYFGIRDNSIVLRNHNLLWKRRQYYFDDIQTIVFERKGYNKLLTVVMKSGKKKQHQGASLGDAHWLSFKQALLARGIEVDDKINFEELLDPLGRKYSRLMVQRLLLWALCTMPVSYFVTTWVKETEGMILVRLLVLAAAFAVCGYAMLKVMRTTSRQYNRAKSERDNSGTLQ